jgi:MFS family permease
MVIHPLSRLIRVAHSIASVDAMRSVQGFFMAPFEALVPASIADVWFVHQRGLRVGIFNLGVLGGINVAGPVSGAIYQNYGYSTLYYGMAGGFILQTILVVFFMPESAYHRSNIFNFDTSSHDVRTPLPFSFLDLLVGSSCCIGKDCTGWSFAARIRRGR